MSLASRPRTAKIAMTEVDLIAPHVSRQMVIDRLKRDIDRLPTGDVLPLYRHPPERVPVPAAVLVPLVNRPSGLQVLLTQRTAHLNDHAGQISFPGGRFEDGDADAVATALREAEEEVGLSRRHVDVIGRLPPYTTVTNYVVTPIVALIQPPFTLQLDDFEVAEAFEVPLSFLMTPAHHQRHEIELQGQRRQFLSMPWEPSVSGGERRRYFIWGATAAMLRNLYGFLSR